MMMRAAVILREMGDTGGMWFAAGIPKLTDED
jgi:hypothetical protein